MTNAREKAIKMYWKMAKEKCPFQTEEIENGYLEGFIDCAEYLLLQNTELEKENAELKEKLKPEKCLKLLAKDGYIKFTSDQLTKAKTVLRNVIDYLGQFCSDYPDCVIEAEQFLNEVEK